MPALDGMRILDLTQYEAGTSCTQALAWLGADVVKVERPGSGDPGRASFEDYGSEESDYFLNWNSNKRSITIALDQPAGRALLMRLVPRFDVFVENFGPGVVEKLDLDYDAVRQANPGIIYGRIKGFGSSGPYSDYKRFDPVALAAGGAFSITGEAGGPPMALGPTIGDSGTGVQMALALCAAYVQKLRTGEGQLVEISMQEAVTYFMRTMIALGSKRGTRATPRRGAGMGALTRLYPALPAAPTTMCTSWRSRRGCGRACARRSGAPSLRRIRASRPGRCGARTRRRWPNRSRLGPGRTPSRRRCACWPSPACRRARCSTRWTCTPIGT